MKIKTTKILLGFTTLILLLAAYGTVDPVQTAKALCTNPYGFVTASISITDITTGNTASGLSTSGYPGGSTSMDYTEGGEVYIEITGGGNSQQDDPVYVQADGFSSNEGNNFGGYSDGSMVPSFSQTFTGFNAGSVTVTAEQCPGDVAYFTIYMNGLPSTPTFTCSVSPSTQTIDPGDDTTYTITTTPLNGFNSPVNFDASISGPAGTAPTISYTNNDQVPAATTTAVVSSTTSTTAGTYSITFTGTAGKDSVQCSPVAQLVVNPLPPNFELTLSPSTGVTPQAPNRSNIGASPVYTVFASCTGGFAGPVTNLAASTTFTGLTLTLGTTSLACGATTTLTISNTGSIPANQQSSIINIISESLVVTGQGQI